MSFPADPRPEAPATPVADATPIPTPLERCAKLRFPKPGRDEHPREKIAALEDYLVETAIVEGEVQELRLSAYRELAACEAAWSAISGWESHLRRPGKTPTIAERDEAKARIDPDTARLLRDAKWTVTRCNEAIERLDRETKRVSRLYAFITGG